MLINFYWIVGIITTFNLQLPNKLNDLLSSFNVIGSSVEFTTYNLECFLSD